MLLVGVLRKGSIYAPDIRGPVYRRVFVYEHVGRFLVHVRQRQSALPGSLRGYNHWHGRQAEQVTDSRTVTSVELTVHLETE